MSVPALRFRDELGRDFADWIERELQEVAEINPKTGLLPNEFVYIDLESVEKGILLKETVISKDDAPSRAQRLLNKEDILFQTVRPYQGNNLFFHESGDYVASTGYAQIRTSENSRFLYQYLHLEDFTAEVMNRCTGTSYPAINSSGLATILINLPTKPEQTKIANFLTAVDEKITQLTQKHDLLTQYKKGVMQQIFSQELRFKDDDGQDFPDWKLNTIAETIDNYGGTALEEFVSVEGTHNFISIGNYEKTGNYFDNGQRIALNDKTKQKLLNKGDLVMVLNDKTQAGDLIGSTLLITEDNKFIYNQRSERLVCKSQIIESKYMWHLFNSKKFRKEIFSISQGGTQIYVNFPAVKKLSIPVPSLKEQSKIANFLTAIDDKITATQTQLQAVKQYKQGLLQQMFV